MKLKTELWDRVNFCGIAEDFAHIIAAAFQRNKAACCQFCFHFQVVWDFNVAAVVVVLLCRRSQFLLKLAHFANFFMKERRARWQPGFKESGKLFIPNPFEWRIWPYYLSKKDKRTSSQHHPNSLQKHVTAAQNRVHDNNKEIKRVPLLASPPSLLWTDRF